MILAFPFPKPLEQQDYILGEKYYQFTIGEMGEFIPLCVARGGGVLYDYVFINHVHEYTLIHRPTPGLFQFYNGDTIQLTTNFRYH